jgi:sugar lactone lactonase YvrE
MTFEVVAKGCYLEGLAVEADAVWVSDAIQGGIQHFRTDGSVKKWLPDKRWIGSLLLNANGVALVSGEGGIMWLDGATGASGMLLDRVDGQPIVGVNEMTPDGKGGIIFGSLDVPAIMRGEPPGPAALYRLDGARRVTQLCAGLKFSNGIAVSPDGRRLYHNETFVGTFVYEIAPDGTLGKPALLLEKPDCDGLALDAEGTLWVAGFQSSAIVCLRPDGTVKRQVDLPAGGVTNIRFGGVDRRDLYVTNVPGDAGEKIATGIWPTADASKLYRTRSDIPGLPVPAAGFRL